MRLPGTARLLAAALAGSGVLHLVRPGVYEWLVPPELGDPRAWVTGSGVAEIAVAASMVVPATRRAGGGAAAALLVAVVPAHLHSLRVVRRPLPRAAAAVRLALQVPLVRVALRVARGA